MLIGDFHLLKLQYELQADDKTGKTKAVSNLTPAKRYSFLVGENEPNHTAQIMILPLLEKSEQPSLKDIEDAFSVDKVSQQFFYDYRDLYERLEKELNEISKKLDQKIKQVFELQSIDTANFAKKLMGQIVFLYFLQKKGWLGVDRDANGDFKEWGGGPKIF